MIKYMLKLFVFTTCRYFCVLLGIRVHFVLNRSSIRPDLQPNKSLLLKAMTDAQKSIETHKTKQGKCCVVGVLQLTERILNMQRIHVCMGGYIAINFVNVTLL